MDIQKERKAFEQHLTDTGLVEFAGYGFAVDECDEYLHEPTQVAWDSWLIGLNRAKTQAVPEGFVLVKASDRNREVLELIDQRDYMEDQAEQLKDKLQELYGVDFGEHSSCNFPFQNAIDYNDSDLILVPKEPTDKTIAHMINTPIEVNLLCDHADVFLSEGEAYIAYQAMIAAQEPTND